MSLIKEFKELTEKITKRAFQLGEAKDLVNHMYHKKGRVFVREDKTSVEFSEMSVHNTSSHRTIYIQNDLVDMSDVDFNEHLDKVRNALLAYEVLCTNKH